MATRLAADLGTRTGGPYSAPIGGPDWTPFDMLAEYWDDGRGLAWKRDRLREFGLPLQRPSKAGPLIVDLKGDDAKGPLGLRHSTSWPRVAALKLEDVRFSFTASSDGALLDGSCHLDLQVRRRPGRVLLGFRRLDGGDLHAGGAA